MEFYFKNRNRKIKEINICFLPKGKEQYINGLCYCYEKNNAISRIIPPYGATKCLY